MTTSTEAPVRFEGDVRVFLNGRNQVVAGAEDLSSPDTYLTPIFAIRGVTKRHQTDCKHRN
jgi:hypothetical protein